MTDKPIVPPEQILYILINQMMDKYESHPLTRAVFEMGYVKEDYNGSRTERDIFRCCG